MCETREPVDDPGRATDSTDVHVPVFATRVSELLEPAIAGPSPVLVDTTLGLGGHTCALLAAHPHLRVIGVDRDPAALRHATARADAAGFGDRLATVHAVYDEIATRVPEILQRWSSPSRHVDAVLFDLGVSSMQLDRADRGFAYAVDAPLDMRMDQSSSLTAADVLATYAEADIARILRDYGEERFAGRVARAVVARRKARPLRTSADLVELLRDAIPAASQRTGGHPAKRTFQALRVEVNDELGALRRAVPAALDLLRVGGRVVFLAYQSLEDRIVKRTVAPLTVSTSPAGLPVELPGHEPIYRWLTRGAEQPSEQEIADNPRSRPARLRAAERLRDADVVERLARAATSDRGRRR